jgi:hypothetical protein
MEAVLPTDGVDENLRVDDFFGLLPAVLLSVVLALLPWLENDALPACSLVRFSSSSINPYSSTHFCWYINSCETRSRQSRSLSTSLIFWPPAPPPPPALAAAIISNTSFAVFSSSRNYRKTHKKEVRLVSKIWSLQKENKSGRHKPFTFFTKHRTSSRSSNSQEALASSNP